MITAQDAIALSELSDIRTPLPLIDLDKISEIVVNTYEHAIFGHNSNHSDQYVINNNPLDTFISYIKEQRKNRVPHVLDIGCGLGRETTYLASRDCEVIGVDASEIIASYARERAARMQSCKFQRMDMQQLQFQQETFDAIWNTRTLIHVPQVFIVDLLCAWKRLLKPGGIICVSVVIGKRRGWGRDDYAQMRPIYNRYFVENELEQALTASGFTTLYRHSTEDQRDHDHPPHCYIIAQKNNSRLDAATYLPLTYTQRKDDAQQDITAEQITSVISDYLKAGTLTAREQVNLCVLYDLLAQSERENTDRFTLAAQKLKLHLQTPDTLSSSDIEVWFRLGQLHLKLKQFQPALQCFERMLQLYPGNFDALVRLSYCYEGLDNFDRAIGIGHQAEEMMNACDTNERMLADLYHALGHFYVGRSLKQHIESSIEDREKGEYYMRKACNIEKHGFQYLSCLAGIYNETRRYSEAVRFLDNIAEMEQFRDHEELYNELHFYRGEACIGIGRYDDAKSSFEVVERYARARHDSDALAHVKLYHVLMSLKGKDISDLGQLEIQTHLRNIHEQEPSLYVGEAFKRMRDRLICILTALYMLKKCLNEQEPPDDFNTDIDQAITYMEKACDEDQQYLDLLVLTDHPVMLKDNSSFLKSNPHIYSFEEIEKDVSETDLKKYHVWAVLILEKQIQPALLAHIAFLLGRFSREGNTIYIFDPHHVLPHSTYSALNTYFVESIAQISQFCYICILNDKIRDYLSSTKRPQRMAPIVSAPALRAAQAEDMWLLPPLASEEGL